MSGSRHPAGSVAPPLLWQLSRHAPVVSPATERVAPPQVTWIPKQEDGLHMICRSQLEVLQDLLVRSAFALGHYEDRDGQLVLKSVFVNSESLWLSSLSRERIHYDFFFLIRSLA